METHARSRQMQFPTHRVTLKFTGIDDAVVIDTVLPTENNPYIVLYTPNDDSPTTTYLKTDFIDAVFKRNPPKIYSHEMFNGPSNLLQYTAKGKGPWLEKATAGYLVMTKNKGVQESSAQPINFLPITILDWNYDPVKNLKNDGRYVPLSFTYSDLYGTREESFNLRVVMGIPKSEEVRAWIEVFYFVLLETKKGTLQLVAFGFGQRAHFRDDFWANYAKEKDIPLKEPGNTGEAKEFDKPPTALNESSGAYIVEFDFAIKDTSGDPRGRLQGPLSREKPLVFLPTYHPTDDQPKRMKTRAVRTFLHEGKLQALIFGNAIEKKHRDMFSSVDEEDINPNRRRFFHDNSGPILQSCTISREPEKKAVNMLPLLGVNKFGEYVDASTVTNWKENMMTLPFDIPYKDAKDRDKTIKAVLIPLWSMKDETFRCFYVCIPDDGKTLLFVALVVFLWPPIDTITSFFTDNFYEKMKTFATKQQAAAKKHKKQVIEAPSPAPASPSMVPLKKRPPPVDPYTLTDPDTGVLTFLAPSPAGLKEGDLDMPGAAVTRQTSTMVTVDVENYILSEVGTKDLNVAKGRMANNWKKIADPSIDISHIQGWVNGFIAWLDNYWWKRPNLKAMAVGPTRSELAAFTKYQTPDQKLTVNDWNTIFGSQGPTAAVPRLALAPRPPLVNPSQFRSGGGGGEASASEGEMQERLTRGWEKNQSAMADAKRKIQADDEKFEKEKTQRVAALKKLQEEEDKATRARTFAESALADFEAQDIERKRKQNEMMTQLEAKEAELRQQAKAARATKKQDLAREAQAERQRDEQRQQAEATRLQQEQEQEELARKMRQEKKQPKTYPASASVSDFFNLYGLTRAEVENAVKDKGYQAFVGEYMDFDDKNKRWKRIYDNLRDFFSVHAGESIDLADMEREVHVFQNTTWAELISNLQDRHAKPEVSFSESQISFLGCAMCTKPKAKTKAGCCGQLRYCGQQCADNHWPRHQSACGNKNGKLFV